MELKEVKFVHVLLAMRHCHADNIIPHISIRNICQHGKRDTSVMTERVVGLGRTEKEMKEEKE